MPHYTLPVDWQTAIIVGVVVYWCMRVTSLLRRINDNLCVLIRRQEAKEGHSVSSGGVS
jgi:hypothetical protein